MSARLLTLSPGWSNLMATATRTDGTQPPARACRPQSATHRPHRPQAAAAVHRRQVARQRLRQDVRHPQPRHRRDHLPGGRGRQGRRRPGRRGRPQGVRGRPLVEDERRRARPAAVQARRPDRAATARNWPRLESLDNGKPLPRRPQRRPAADRSSATATTPAGPTRSTARRSPSRATSSATRATSRSAWSGRSSRGTSRC